MKTIAATIIILIVCLTSISGAQTIPGDCDHNGIVNYSDVRCMENYLRTLEPDNPESMSYLDLDADCDIDCEDIDYLRAYLLESGPSPLTSHCRHPEVDTCCWQMPGDPNLDGIVDLSDAVMVINYIYGGGLFFTGFFSNLDATTDCVISTDDAVFIIESAFADGPDPENCTCRKPRSIFDLECKGTCGDVNSDGSLDISDAIYLMNYLYGKGPPPYPVLACGNVHWEETPFVNIDDVLYLINYSFSGGNPPKDCNYGLIWDDGQCCEYTP